MGPHVAEWELSKVADDNDEVLIAAWNRRAALSSRPAGEAVAWASTNLKFKLELSGEASVFATKSQVATEPLYAHPAPPIQKAEPCGWQVLNDDGAWRNEEAGDVEYWRNRNFQVRPIYTHPVQPELTLERDRLVENVRDLSGRKRVTGEFRDIFKARATALEEQVGMLREALDQAEMRITALEDELRSCS